MKQKSRGAILWILGIPAPERMCYNHAMAMKMKNTIPAVKQNPKEIRDKTLESIFKAKFTAMRGGEDMNFSPEELVSIPGDQRTKLSWRDLSGNQQEIITESRDALVVSLAKIARDVHEMRGRRTSPLFKAWILPHFDPKERFTATSIEEATHLKDSQRMSWPILIAPWGRSSFYVVRDQAAFEEKVADALSEASHEMRVHVVPVTEPTYAPRASVVSSLEGELKTPENPET